MLFEDLPGRKSARLLAVSENLLVYSLYEQGFVTDGIHAHEVGAGIHGDPVAGVIARDESWCAVAGAGLEVLLAAPGRTLAQATPGEAFSVPVPWVEALWVMGPRALGLVAAPDARHPHRRLLQVDVDRRQVRSLPDAED